MFINKKESPWINAPWQHDLWLFLSYKTKSPGVIIAFNDILLELDISFKTKYVLSVLNTLTDNFSA